MATEIGKPSKRRRTSISRGEDDYMRGNIMKMELHNFMTYSHIESRPAPRLNLVIGPNGTGKSSLVCALAIGLGGEPQLLGRAGHIGDFVKRGEESAWIKITLRGNTADESIVITRKFNKQNKSEWLLDGRPVSKKVIQETVQQFNIQVNNLTQFLPQDRVCEFAKMTPVQLLEETEKAVGDPELAEQHLTLIKRSQELKQRQVTVSKLQSTFSQHQQNNAELEKDVERVQQRNRLLSRAAAMRLKLPWLRYDKEKSIYKEAKDREREAKKKLEDIKHDIARMKAPIITQKRRGEELERDCEEVRSRKSRNERKRRDLQHRVNDLRERAKTTMAAIEELHRAEAGRQHRIEAARKAVEEAEQEYANLPIDETPREELESLNRQLQEFEEANQERRVNINELSALENQKKNQIDAYQRRKEEIQTVTNQQLEALKRSGAHKIFEAYNWVQEHRHEFKETIYGPVLLEVKIPNKDYAAFVEGHVAYYIWKAFITQDPDDRDRLVRCLKPYGVPVINFTGEGSQGPGLQITQEMRNLGITHTLDQVVDAPDVVKKVLIGQFSLNYAFIGTAVSNQRANEVCKSGIRDLWTPENHFRWKESRYGGPMSASVDPVQPARFFTRSVDMNELIEMDRKISEASTALASLQKNVRDLTSEQRRLENEAAVFYRQREEIHSRTREIRNARKKLQAKIVQRRGRLESLQAEESTERAESNYRRDIAEANRSRCMKILELKDCHLQAVEDHILYSLKTLASAEVDAKVKSLERDFREQERTGICAQQDYDTRKNELMRCRSQLQAAKEEAEGVAKITPELQADFASMPDTVEDLEDAIADHEAQARTVFCPNPNVLEEYERRCEQIRDASRMLEVETAALDACRTDIETIQANWLSSLRAIVAKINTTFSRNFEEMAVAGEVSLDEQGTDFDRYGIHIKVKFREKGELQLLSGHHQSGGERSVSTILYLISLQDLTHCPFRAVDEINQGMDPINERKMFQQLVRAASQPNTPQCFLLTPKLLPDLSYSEACSILNIMNGPWMAAAAEVWKTGSSYVQVLHGGNTDG